jgi:hypothetical protein
MKKITFLILVMFGFISYAQVLNQPANWPNASWTITGTYDANPNVFTDNPTVSSNFSYDDDEPGSSSDNDVAAESPVIDLTAAFNAGEFGLELNSEYVLNTYEDETITIQYWDADSNSWVNWSNSINDNTPGAPNVNFCEGPSASFNSGTLNIAGFSPNQLSNFRYRIYYQDNGSWGWGFCFNSPTLLSGAAATCPTVSNLFVNNITTTTANVFWTPNGTETLWEIAIQPAGTGVPTNGTLTINTAPYSATGLNVDTAYEIFVRARCTASDYSTWAGPVNFSTAPPSRVVFSQVDIDVSGYDMAVVDMNGDFLDDIVGVSTSNINIQQQNANGSFTERNISTPAANFLPSWSLAAGDYNADGYTDLLYGAGSGVTFMMSNSDGSAFTEQSTTTEQYTFSQRSNFVDINNDGNLDAFVCHDVEPNVYFMNDSEGNGSLTFYQSDVTPDAPYSLGNYPSGGDYGSIWIDYNNDRNIDLFIAKCGGSEARRTNMMITNNGDGTFTENAASKNLADPMQTWSSAWGDFDNDGDMDVFVGASSGSHKLMRNNGAPNFDFTNVTAGSGISAPTGWESSAYDIDNDGYLDIISNGSIMYGKSDLTFEDPDTSQINYKNGSFGDLNNDGFIDLYYNGKIYYNQGNSNNWVKINTIGMGYQTSGMSNRNGIGARVEITTASGTQIRDVRSGEGFEFMSSLNTHFGIGSETTIQTITIYWPSGTIDVINNPAINTTHTVIEGDTLSITDENLADVSIYPNPVEDQLQIITSADVTNKIATVFDINGKRIINVKLNTNSLDVSNLQSGVYFLRLESEGKSIKRKFIKK